MGASHRPTELSDAGRYLYHARGEEDIMAYTSITFENPHTGAIKEAPVGLSWTAFLFGCFPALFRGDWKWAVIMSILALITWTLSGFVFLFIYNKLYIKDLIGSGYKAKSIASGESDFAASKLGMQIPRVETA